MTLRIAARMPACAVAATLFCAIAVCQDVPKEVILQVTEEGAHYVLTVPVSQLVMTIPKGGLVIKSNPGGGSADNPRYFLFEDESEAFLVSGWFESDDGFPGIEQFWTNETAEWKRKGLPEPRDVVFVQLGNWNAILYDEDVPLGKNSHIRAHLIQAGTWIDIHLSLTADLPLKEIREKLQAKLKAIQVTEKQ